MRCSTISIENLGFQKVMFPHLFMASGYSMARGKGGFDYFRIWFMNFNIELPANSSRIL
jgi:hypothetical protein